MRFVRWGWWVFKEAIFIYFAFKVYLFVHRSSFPHLNPSQQNWQQRHWLDMILYINRRIGIFDSVLEQAVSECSEADASDLCVGRFCALVEPHHRGTYWRFVHWSVLCFGGATLSRYI